MEIFVNEGDSLNAILSGPRPECDDTVVYILPKNGVFREKIFVKQSRIEIRGNMSRLVWNDHNDPSRAHDTTECASVQVLGSDVSFYDTVFENDFDYPGELEKRMEAAEREGVPVGRIMGLQAVSLHTLDGTERCRFENCAFVGFQDTLFVDGVDSVFINCSIYGNIDFIFGRSRSVFENCRIVSNGPGYVAAPSTMADKSEGLLFRNCVLTSTGDVEPGSVYLARPWHQWGKSGVSSFARFEGCTFGSHINKDLWTTMWDSKGVLHKPEENRFSVSDCRFED